MSLYEKMNIKLKGSSINSSSIGFFSFGVTAVRRFAMRQNIKIFEFIDCPFNGFNSPKNTDDLKFIYFKKQLQMKTILFPTDFSKNAEHASKYAAMLATNLHAKLVLLNIYSIPMISEFQLPNDIEVFLQQNKEEAEHKLNSFKKHFIGDTSINPEKVSIRVEYGFVGDKIKDIANEINADLIVMGTKGANNTFDKWIGTNAQKVMKTAPCPVWVIPQKASLNYPANILYAADLQENEVEATHKVLSFARLLVSKCTLLHIHDAVELNVSNQLEAMIDFLKDEFNGENITFKQLNRSNIIEGLETYIHTHKPDILALAIHDKSIFSKIFEASVTKHFVQVGNLPILTFRK